MATEILVKLANSLYEVVEQVKGNTQRCNTICERTKRLMSAIIKVTSTPSKKDVRAPVFIFRLYLFIFLPSRNLSLLLPLPFTLLQAFLSSPSN